MLVKPSETIKLFEYYNELGQKYPETKIVYATSSGQMREQFLKPKLATLKGLTLDLGCNTGHYKPYIEKYVGLDIAGALLRKFKANRVWACAQNLPFKNETFDNILLTEVLEHIPEHQQVLRECNHVLKPCGNLLITTPYGDNPYRRMSFPICAKYNMPVTAVLHGSFNLPYMQVLACQTGFTIVKAQVFERGVRFYAHLEKIGSDFNTAINKSFKEPHTLF